MKIALFFARPHAHSRGVPCLAILWKTVEKQEKSAGARSGCEGIMRIRELKAGENSSPQKAQGARRRGTRELGEKEGVGNAEEFAGLGGGDASVGGEPVEMVEAGAG